MEIGGILLSFICGLLGTVVAWWQLAFFFLSGYLDSENCFRHWIRTTRLLEHLAGEYLGKGQKGS